LDNLSYKIVASDVNFARIASRTASYKIVGVFLHTYIRTLHINVWISLHSLSHSENGVHFHCRKLSLSVTIIVIRIIRKNDGHLQRIHKKVFLYKNRFMILHNKLFIIKPSNDRQVYDR